MKAKYGCGPMAMPEVKHHSNPSRTWRGIVTSWPLVKSNIRWIIRNRLGVRFWKDHWLPGISSLQDILGDQIPHAEQNFTVSHYARDGVWDWEHLQHYLTPDLCQHIAIIKPPCVGPADFPSWDLSHSGQFVLKSAYQVVREEVVEAETHDPVFDKVWQWQGPRRYQAHLWKIAHILFLSHIKQNTKLVRW